MASYETFQQTGNIILPNVRYINFLKSYIFPNLQAVPETVLELDDLISLDYESLPLYGKYNLKQLPRFDYINDLGLTNTTVNGSFLNNISTNYFIGIVEGIYYVCYTSNYSNISLILPISNFPS